MSNNGKTYQINFSIIAKDINDAIIKAKSYIEKNPNKAIKEIGDKDKYKIYIANK